MELIGYLTAALIGISLGLIGAGGSMLRTCRCCRSEGRSRDRCLIL